MTNSPLAKTIRELLTPGKGILAADESSPTIAKRFADINLTSTEESRRDYREMLFTTPGLNTFISGVILYDETLRQNLKDGTPMREALAGLGIVPGIKVDAGAVPLANFKDEKITQGLDGLRERLAEYRDLGAHFTKWRAVITIGSEQPTTTCLISNAQALAQFAALSQEVGLVPIVEPEVLMEGNHTIDRCEEVITRTLQEVFAALVQHRVVLENMILKSSMVLSGTGCSEQADLATVVQATLRCFRRTVPAAVPGIVFLSGGQGEVKATERLNALGQVHDLPWKLTFSYGRALQAPSIKAWGGLPGNLAAGQKALQLRARCNGLATQGKYSSNMEG